MWGWQGVDRIWQDLRYAWRGFLRSPAFTVTAVISLALGIGANSAIFTAVSAIFLKPLAVRDPATLVVFSATDARGRITNSYPASFGRLLRSSNVFANVIGVSSDGLSFEAGDRAERIMGEVVTPNFFPALGVSTVLGKGFSRDVRDGKWAAEAVLSYGFWKSRFGGDTHIIGRVIRLNTYPFVVTGVSAANFHDLHQGEDPELRIALLPPGRKLEQLNILDPEQDLDFMARLRPGVSRAQAQAAASAQLHEWMRSNSRGRRVEYRQLRLFPGDRGWPELAGEFRTPLTVLFLLVFLVLLIACANVANMSLARAGARRREIAVRSSLGAGRGRLIQQTITESLLLASFAALAGWQVSRLVSQFLLHFLPQGHMRLVLDLNPGADALVFTVVISMAAALFFGAIVAYQSTRGNLVTGLKSDAGGSLGGAEPYMLKKFLVAGQIAFSLALLIVAGLFIRTVFNLRPDRDFADPGRVLVFTMKPQEEIYSPERIRSLTAELIRRVSALPGIEAVSLAENGPFASRQDTAALQLPGGDVVEASDDSVWPGFFHTLRLPLLAGRDFTSADKPGSPKVMVINQSLNTALFGRQNALGRMVEMPSPHGSQFFQVIGVVGDSHYYDPRREGPAAFFAFQNDPPYMPTLHVRVASANAAAYIPAIRREFDTLDKGFPVFNVRTMEDRIEDALSRERMIGDLSAIFGMLALGLAGVGLYGVFTYSVTQRTREIGLRMALGSQMGSVLWMVIREALLLVAVGVGIGCVLAVGGARLISNQLYGVAPGDPATLLAAAGAMLIIALLAVAFPAWRASRIDPVIALRQD